METLFPVLQKQLKMQKQNFKYDGDGCGFDYEISICAKLGNYLTKGRGWLWHNISQ